jgi:thiol:disulfide interchange protein/DsbC/DsbD-like thiol-disulfide interchange protein
MRPLLPSLAASLLLTASALAGTGATVATDNVKARLISENASIAPGSTFTVALELDIRDGWHTYWRNPGDSGQATRLKWTLPPLFLDSEIQWTRPHRFDVPPLVNYGYSHHAVHLVEIRAPKELQPGDLTLAATANWLVCSDICIPESADLQLVLPVGDGAKDPATAPTFDAARADLPQPAPGTVSADLKGQELELTLNADWGDLLEHTDEVSFFPVAEGSIEYAAPQKLARDGNALKLALKVGYAPPKSGPIEGVLVLTQGKGAQALHVPMTISAPLTVSGAAAAATAAPRFAKSTQAAAPAAPVNTDSLLTLALSAILGGLILNLMPCVFPVLSIKAISLAEQSKKSPGAVRLKGIAFTLGVLASMLALAGALLALRAAGQQIGWGFQLQSPVLVTLVAYLMLAVGLNLSGVFEFGGSLAGVGDGLTRGNGLSSSFFTGVLTTVVATPCTAPFMATAIGAALARPSGEALLIFSALGFGLSLPFLLLSFAPGLRRFLPRPGAWMDTLKQVFAFPMYASAAWLLWVLAQQVSPGGLAAALTGLVLIGLAAWAFQKSHSSMGTGRAAALIVAVLALGIALFLPTRMEAAVSGGPAARGATGDEWQPYDVAALQTLVDGGKPVLVNFTASWCLTCLVNERNAFADSDVQATFKRKGVVLMKGDWTNREASITQALSQFGRAGVPLYVVYNSTPGTPGPKILPQLLSASLVRDTFAKLPDR